MNAITIRQLNESDAQQVSSLLQCCFDYLEENGFFPTGLLEGQRNIYTETKIMSLIQNPSTVGCGAFSGGRLVGFLWGTRSHGMLYLEWGGVAPEFRRRGIYTRLLRTVEEETARLGCHKLWFFTSEQNTPGIRAYIKQGYTIEGRHPKHFLKGSFLSIGKVVAAEAQPIAA